MLQEKWEISARLMVKEHRFSIQAKCRGKILIFSSASERIASTSHLVSFCGPSFCGRIIATRSLPCFLRQDLYLCLCCRAPLCCQARGCWDPFLVPIPTCHGSGKASISESSLLSSPASLFTTGTSLFSPVQSVLRSPVGPLVPTW